MLSVSLSRVDMSMPRKHTYIGTADHLCVLRGSIMSHYQHTESTESYTYSAYLFVFTVFALVKNHD